MHLKYSYSKLLPPSNLHSQAKEWTHWVLYICKCLLIVYNYMNLNLCMCKYLFFYVSEMFIYLSFGGYLYIVHCTCNVIIITILHNVCIYVQTHISENKYNKSKIFTLLCAFVRNERTYSHINIMFNIFMYKQLHNTYIVIVCIAM